MDLNFLIKSHLLKPTNMDPHTRNLIAILVFLLRKLRMLGFPRWHDKESPSIVQIFYNFGESLVSQHLVVFLEEPYKLGPSYNL